jgi:hypothetical protein
LQVEGQGRLELNATTVGGVCEREPRGMEEWALEALDGVQVSCGSAPYAAVSLIADDRVSDRAKVDADLMCAAGRDRHVQQ